MSSKRNLRAAIEESGGVRSFVSSDKYENMTNEELKLAAFESRHNQDIDITQKMANDNKRNALLQKAGFDWFDIDDLHPHPDNHYSINEEDIVNLAGLIYESSEIQPLVLRETEDGIQIIDGERRWRACKLLSELYGDEWRMVPAHCHPYNSLTEQQVEFILNANNIGQRELTPSEKAKGFSVIADALVEWRKTDPSLKGVKTKTYLAKHFNVSERTAMTNLAIARNLSAEGKELLDKGLITQEQAESISRLPEEDQSFITESVIDKNLSKEETGNLIEEVKHRDGTSASAGIDDIPTSTSKRKTPETNTYLTKARNALRKACRQSEPASYAILGEIKEIIRAIEDREQER